MAFYLHVSYVSHSRRIRCLAHKQGQVHHSEVVLPIPYVYFLALHHACVMRFEDLRATRPDGVQARINPSNAYRKHRLQLAAMILELTICCRNRTELIFITKNLFTLLTHRTKQPPLARIDHRVWSTGTKIVERSRIYRSLVVLALAPGLFPEHV